MFHPIRPQDIAAVVHLQARTYRPELHEGADLFERIRQAPGAICLYADDGTGKMAGYVFGYPSRRDRATFEDGPQPLAGPGDGLYLHDLCIAPELQGQGVAKALYRAFEARARAAGHAQIFAISITTALPFWLTCGYTAHTPATYHGIAAQRIEKRL